MKETTKTFTILVAVALVIVVGAGALTHVIVRGVEEDCTERCEGRGEDVASFTVFGCECRPTEAPKP